MKNKISIAFLFVMACILFAAAHFISGCGSTPTSEGTPTSGGPNNGAISGAATKIETGINKISALSGVHIKVNPETVTGSDGGFDLTGIPSGMVQLTATKETSGVWGITMLTDRDTAYFDFEQSGGTAVNFVDIRGTIESIPAGETLDHVNVYVSNILYNSHPTFDATTGTYEASHVPISDTGTDTLYVMARADSGGNDDVAYNRINVSSGGHYNCNVTYSALQTIEVSDIFVPAGYTVSQYDVYLVTSSGRRLASISTPPSYSAHVTMSNLPVMLSGDKYNITMLADNGTSNLYKQTRLFPAGNGIVTVVSLDATDIVLFDIVTPDSTVTTWTSWPTFEWTCTTGTVTPDYILITVTDSVTNKRIQYFAPSTQSSIETPVLFEPFYVTGRTYSYIFEGIHCNDYPGFVNNTYLLDSIYRNPSKYDIFKSDPGGATITYTGP